MMAEIVERTDGIPLFVEEMTKAVQRLTHRNKSKVECRLYGNPVGFGLVSKRSGRTNPELICGLCKECTSRLCSAYA